MFLTKGCPLFRRKSHARNARASAVAFGIMNKSIPHVASEGITSADVISFRYEEASEGKESTIDLSVLSQGMLKRFRLFSPQQLRIGGTFPQIGFLQIMDIEDRQFDRLKVLVLDGEQNESIWFYARDLEVLTP
jgi:hypothetical protein